jgi:hypothetical protein
LREEIKMYKLIVGKQGSGKTKKIIDMANEHVKTLNGDIVYIDDNKHHMLELKHEMRLISMEEFPINNPDEFYGFLCGIISNNYDIEAVYIDDLDRIVGVDLAGYEAFILKAQKLSDEYKVNFIYTVPAEADQLPASLKDSVIG